MDTSRIKVGTRIKIIADPISPYIEIGDVATIVISNCYHTPGSITDMDGQYWVKPEKPGKYEKICIGDSDNSTGCFKILKY